ncbi:MAG: ATP-binding cassette domain-containing protein, partial [Mycobacterium sp.]
MPRKRKEAIDAAQASSTEARGQAARKGQLRPVELAEAAILGDMALGLQLLGWLVPFPFGAAMHGASVVPLAALDVRHRPRAVVVSTVATSGVAFLVGGIGLAVQMGVAGLIGLAIGTSVRRHWGVVRSVILSTAMGGIPLALLGVGLLALFSSLRHLTLAQVQLSWNGMAHLLRLVHLQLAAHWGDQAVAWSLSHWWLTLPLATLVGVVGLAYLGAAFGVPALERLARVTGHAQIHVAPPLDRGGVPLRLEDVSFRYPGARTDALAGVDLHLPGGRLVAIVGPNGSGKSTLARVLGGASPTGGTVERKEHCDHRTAMVFQRPESQVLGVRVADDVVWGLPRGANVDVSGLLRRVGLGGLDDRETSTLSGGQLQRLAIAAALARRPALLISDEST